ncbi:winged helix-turn-helix domain-containing protein [Nocardiopsis xinjiangensis]|uniref:winged helix-turn-helix domain-containing protein n=1 Tax=Nocardiopsis xinjiangensis TaxID=124285 RepID=UPI00034B2588|nr:winged helix-turn-helix domain-containing protein [Nocardiopsis xinjiangensis]
MIDLDGPEPVYRQIARVIRERIADGTYKLDRTIPSEAGACEEFGVSRRTARSAYSLLKDEGLILRVPGRGTFAVKRPE